MGVMAGVTGIIGTVIESAQTLCELIDTIKHVPEEARIIPKDTCFQECLLFSPDGATGSDGPVRGDRRLFEIVERL